MGFFIKIAAKICLICQLFFRGGIVYCNCKNIYKLGGMQYGENIWPVRRWALLRSFPVEWENSSEHRIAHGQSKECRRLVRFRFYLTIIDGRCYYEKNYIVGHDYLGDS